MGSAYPAQRNALTELVKSAVGRGKRWSLREFTQRAVDPETHWAPSKSLLGKIVNDEGFRVEPRLVSALAVGLGLPRDVVAAAAHWQVIGYSEEELNTSAPATLVRHLSSVGAPAPLARAVAEGWEAEDRDRGSAATE
ncbi:hypothetical protein [Streptomyces sp. NPDC057253]|uniref:hypothetical protein n=1 Tax=Streptomyces sp. NPDC057253 TaxID=3346069 RepID=UPI00363B0BE5